MGTLERGVTHPQIHIDYYDWLKQTQSDSYPHKDFVKRLINEAGGFATFHSIAMFAWSQSRETLAENAERFKSELSCGVRSTCKD